jgi:ABC-type amino acid transport substrate-binding protein
MNKIKSSASSALMLILALCLSQAYAGDTPKTAPMPELVACLSDNNAPFSSSNSGGIDAEVSRGIGEILHRSVRISWIAIPERGGLGKALRQAMKPGNCDLFFGIPVNGTANEDVVEQHLETSEAYLSTGYVLVAARGSNVRTLEDARRAQRVGVVTATPADMYLHKQHFNRIPYGNNRDLLDALSEGAVNAAVLWLPALANAEQQGFDLWPNAIRDERLPSPDLETHFVIAVRSGEADLKAKLDTALAHLRSDGSLAGILRRHRMARTLVQ